MASILTDETLYQNRNCKQLHDEALHISKKRHDQVHDNAVAALRLHELRLEQDQAKQLADQAEALLEAERAKAAEEIRIRKAENAVKLIPQPPPRVPTPPPQQPTPQATVNKPAPAPQSNHATPQQPSLSSQQATKQPQQQPKQESTPNIASSTDQSGQATLVAQHQAPQATPRRPSLLNSTTQHTIPNTAHVPLNPELVKHTGIDPTVAGLEYIHQTCKKMRQYLKTQPKEYIKHAGDLRRKIKMTLGQLLEQGGNKVQMQTIAKILLGSFEYPGEHVDPQMFILDRPAPDSTAKHNGATMPLLFVYLLNIFAKAIVAQLISEASAKPAAAEPIGVLAHQIFSQPEFQWRNVSFIDILLAKYRYACPIIFGLTGNEKTDAGRNRVGWKNDMGTWVSPQEHNERMIGLGAGYAALTLRNYGKSTRKNPYSPYHYWTAIATIVNTDPDKVCATQFTVLKAMIENHADKFISFYGDMAVAALRVAVISFPACAKETTIAVKSLQVLAEKWQNENGFFVI